MGDVAWLSLVGGVLCLLNCDDEQDLDLLENGSSSSCDMCVLRSKADLLMIMLLPVA